MQFLVVLFFAISCTCSQSYTPTTRVRCPTTPLLRTFSALNQTLHPEEVSYVTSRSQQSPQAWKDWIGDSSELGYNLSQFETFPRVGMAFSGGGYRASFFTAGVLTAFDARNETSRSKGTGGLLQVTQYMSGLSGGSWLISSLVYNAFPQIRELVLGNTDLGGNLSGWLLDLNVIAPNGIDIFGSWNRAYYESILKDVRGKYAKGFRTTISDYWSRIISYRFLSGTTCQNFFTDQSSHGAGLLWSDIKNFPTFQNFSYLFPIVIADSRPSELSKSTDRPSLSSTIYELTPFEMGSFDPWLSSMADIQYIGTTLVNGQPENSSACVTGFDQASFLIGTVSSLWNIVLGRVDGTAEELDLGHLVWLLDVLNTLLSDFTAGGNDVANWPIGQIPSMGSTLLRMKLVDGGENAENVPLSSLFLRARNLDVIVALDSTAETTNGTKFNFPNGTAIRTTRDRITTLLNTTHQGFPPVPDDFAATGVNLRPTFFGRNPTINPPEWPLLIYIPNAPPVNGVDPVTNTGAFKESYTLKHQNLFLDQAFSLGTSGFLPESTDADPNFPKCLQCAAIDRGRLAVSPPIHRSNLCTQCFLRYCFDPANPPTASEIPGRKFRFVDPDLQGLEKLEVFLRKQVVPLAISFGIALLVFLGLLVLSISRIKRRASARKKSREYQLIDDMELDEMDPDEMEASDTKRSVDASVVNH